MAFNWKYLYTHQILLLLIRNNVDTLFTIGVVSGFKDSKVKTLILFQFGMTLFTRNYYGQEKKGRDTL